MCRLRNAARLALLLAALAAPAIAQAQPAFDAVGVHEQSASATNTLSFTLGAGSNRVLYCAATSGGNGVGVSGVTYDGDAGTELYDAASSPGFVHTAIYRWKEADGLATGTANVVATFGSSTNSILGCMSFNTVDQTTPDDGVTANRESNGASGTNTLTSAVGDLAIDFVSCSGGGVSSASPDTGTERIDDNFAADAQRLFASHRTGAASVTMAWTWNTSICSYVSAALNLNVAGGGGGGGAPSMRMLLGVGEDEAAAQASREAPPCRIPEWRCLALPVEARRPDWWLSTPVEAAR